MKLHLGCGKRHLEGYINIDAKHPKADLIHDRLDMLPYPDNSVEEIVAIHLFEHLWPQDVGDHVLHWYNLLHPGGKLILELPDLYKSCLNYIRAVDDGHITPSLQMAMWPIFGDNPDKNIYDCHKWGWTYQTLVPVLKGAGFSFVKEAQPEWHGQRVTRDLRVEAIK